jgi:hypothetical protein
MSVSVTLKIPNKEKHIADRDTLQGSQTVYETSITELTITHTLLTQQRQTVVANITLDDAVTRLEKYKHDVGEYNQKCQTTQNHININNDELQQLLDRIQLAKTEALAEKAATDAAAAKTAADQAAALQSANRALQEYIATLQEQLPRINDNNLDEIAGQIQHHTDTIRTFGTEYPDSLLSDEAISQDTKTAITAFKADTVKEVDSNTRNFDTLKGNFEKAKNTIADALNAKIQALEAVALGANVTAKQITYALNADKQNPIDDTSLGEIKGRATELATDIGTKATVNLHKRKAEIDRLIDADKASFEEKQKITEEFKKITDIFDSKEFKDKEATIQANIFTASEAHKVVVNDKGNDINKHLANTRFGTAITGLNASIFSLETELNKIHNLEPKLQELQARSAKIQQPPIDVAPIQVRLDELKKAKNEYDRLNLAQQARAKELTAKRSTQTQLQPSPPTVARPLSALHRGASRAFNEGGEIEGADLKSAPLEPTRTPGRRYSIFIPTPTTLKEQLKSPSRVEAATVVTGNIAEDDIDPTVLEIFVYEDEAGSAPAVKNDSSSGGGTSRRRVLLRSQRGGAPPKVAKIIKVSEITPEIQNLFLSFQSPNQVLTPEFLTEIEKTGPRIIVIPRDIDSEMTKFNKSDLIDNTDETPFLKELGQKASHKTTVEKLMMFLDKKRVRPTQNGKDYTAMYLRLWQFMEFTSGSITVLRSMFKDAGIVDTSRLLSATPTGITQRRSDLTWSSSTNNKLFDILFMELSKCYNKSGKDDGSYSLFLETQVLKKGAQKYRFMLNWTILIAFHLYYVSERSEHRQQYDLLLGEFIEHLYNTFIGWMETMDPNTLINLFIPVSQTPLTYESGVKKLIDSNIRTDRTLEPFIKNIRGFLCANGDKGNRKNPPGKSPPHAKKSIIPPLALPLHPTEPYPGDSGSGSDSDSELDETVAPGLRRSSQSARGPPLDTQPQPGVRMSSQSARGPPTQSIPPFATSPAHITANAMADGGKLPSYAKGEPATIITPTPPLGSLSHQTADGRIFRRRVQTSIGDKPSHADQLSTGEPAVSTIITPKPPLRPLSPETSRRIRDPLFTRRINRTQTAGGDNPKIGGHKRTRKHRSVPSSVPVPASATCRRHHSSTKVSSSSSSSSQKRTRRRRASIRT